MPEKIVEHVTLFMYALAAISGGLGGFAIASHSLIRGNPTRASYFLAYGVLGVAFGVLALAYGHFFGMNSGSIDRVVGNSVIAGAVGSVVLASTNISARWILKRFGIEVQVTVKRRGECD